MSASIPPRDAARSLLPEGLRDDLPPWAEYEAALVDKLMASFAGFGYERVAPPLVEFEESLLAGTGESQRAAMFRVLDPESHRMMAVRSDITPQVARIATTRLKARARPLRLSYAGHVLRVRGTQLRPARQFRQAGVELIGADSMEADLEVILLAAKALGRLGIEGLSVDLVSPTMVPTLARELGLDAERAKNVRRALDSKNAGALESLDGDAIAVFRALMEAAGAIAQSRPRLEALELPPETDRIRNRLLRLAETLDARAPDLAVTLDPGEMRGFEYHTGIGFAFFVAGVRSEIGRGGRYRVGAGEGRFEEAVGFSMYLDSLLRAAPPPVTPLRLYLPCGADRETAERLRGEGWRTVMGLEAAADPRAEARRLGCTHVLENGAPAPITEEGG